MGCFVASIRSFFIVRMLIFKVGRSFPLGRLTQHNLSKLFGPKFRLI